MNFFEIHFAAGTYMRYFRMLCTVAAELQRKRACVELHRLYISSTLLIRFTIA